MLESVAEYFENIFNSQVADGSLAKKREHQIEQRARRKMYHKLLKRYDKKVRHVMEQHHWGDGCHSRQGNKYYCHDYKWQDCNDSSHCSNYDKRKKKQEDNTPSWQGVQAMLYAQSKEQAHLQGVLQEPQETKKSIQGAP